MTETFEDFYQALNDALAEAGSDRVLGPPSPPEAIEAATLELYRRFQALERRSDEEAQLQGKKGLRLVGRARKCLLDPVSRAEYDEYWRGRDDRRPTTDDRTPATDHRPPTSDGSVAIGRDRSSRPARMPIPATREDFRSPVVGRRSSMRRFPVSPFRALAVLALVVAFSGWLALHRFHFSPWGVNGRGGLRRALAPKATAVERDPGPLPSFLGMDALRGIAARMRSLVALGGRPEHHLQARHQMAVRLAEEADTLLDEVEGDIVKFKRRPPAPRQLARIRQAIRRKTSQAAERSRRAIQADPAYAPGYVCRVQALRWLLQYRQAHAVAVKALARFPQDEELRSEYAILREKIGRG